MDEEYESRIGALLQSGEPIKCSGVEYRDMRAALLEMAGELIDAGDAIRAQICLSEVQRLDILFE